MVPDTNPLLADSAVIRADLEYMTARWGELDTPAVFEIRAFKEGSQPQTAKFSPDWMDDAVEWCESMNGLGFNIYAVRNPIRHDITGSAKDSDILASFFLWADCDDDHSAGNVLRFDGPKYSAAVTTGRTPSVRVHVYWALEAPCTDMDAWRDMQTRIAAHFNSDKAVVNPSRIMRVGGTVAHPAQHKRDKGYTKFLTTLRTEYPEPRHPVTFDQMGRVFAPVAAQPSNAIHVDGFKIETGTYQNKSAADYADILRRARTDGEKHTGVRDLAASLAGSGVPRTMAEAVIREACPVWDAGVEKLIETAYAKFAPVPSSPFKIETGPAEQGEEPAAEDANKAPTWPTPMSQFDESALPRRRWVYGTSYIRNYVSVVASAGGIGKTSLAIVEALAIITGRPLLGEAVKEPCNAWVINLEDPREEMEMRTLAAMKFHGVKPEDVTGKLFIDGEDDIEITLAAEGRDGLIRNDALLNYMRDKIIENEIGVVIIDPFVSTHLVNENANASIQAVVAMLRSLARQTNAAVTLVHHTRKGNGDDATVDSVRGAGSLIGAARSARVVNRVSQEDAERLGVSPKEAKGIFRVDDGKANLAPPPEEALYRRMVGVQLANEEWVGVATKFDLPDEWSGMSESVVNEILSLIDQGPKRNDGSEEYYSARPQDKTRWVGQVILDYPFKKQEDFKTDGQAKAIIRQWLKSGLLEEVEYHSAAQRKDRKGVVSTGRTGEVR